MKAFILTATLLFASLQATTPLTADTINSTVNSLAAVIAARYFDIPVTGRVSAALEEKRRSGAFA